MDKTMKITGKGKVSVKPDIIRLNMTMEESYKEYELTLRQSSETIKILKELFVSLGFKNDDLKTRSFDINTKYESYKAKDQSWKKRLIGYTYTLHMLIEFDADNKKLGEILYALAHSVITLEISIEYTVSDPEKHKDKLLKNAIEDSKHKAEVLANAADVELGDIVSIDYSWGEISFVSESSISRIVLLLPPSVIAYSTSLSHRSEISSIIVKHLNAFQS